MATLLDILRAVGDELGRASGVATSGSTTTIIDTSVDSPFQAEDDDELFKNAWALVEADSSLLKTNVGTQARIKTYAPDTGTVTLTKTLAATIANTHTYSVYFGLPPFRDGVHRGIADYVNDVIRKLYYEKSSLLSLVSNGDMEIPTTSPLVTWTAVESGTGTYNSDWSAGGAQSIKVERAAAAQSVKSTSFHVEPGRSYEVFADIFALVGTPQIKIADSETDEILGTFTLEAGAQKVGGAVQIPPTTYSVEVFLHGVEDASTIYWDNVVVRPSSCTRMPIDVTNPKFFQGVIYETNSDRARRDQADVNWWGLSADKKFVDFQPFVPFGHSSWALHLEPYDELSVAANVWEETSADKDWVTAFSLSRIYNEHFRDAGLAKVWWDRAIALHKAYSPETKKGKLKLRGAWQ